MASQVELDPQPSEGALSLTVRASSSAGSGRGGEAPAEVGTRWTTCLCAIGRGEVVFCGETRYVG